MAITKYLCDRHFELSPEKLLKRIDISNDWWSFKKYPHFAPLRRKTWQPWAVPTGCFQKFLNTNTNKNNSDKGLSTKICSDKELSTNIRNSDKGLSTNIRNNDKGLSTKIRNLLLIDFDTLGPVESCEKSYFLGLHAK